MFENTPNLTLSCTAGGGDVALRGRDGGVVCAACSLSCVPLYAANIERRLGNTTSSAGVLREHGGLV
jgi:hypothetical protein